MGETENNIINIIDQRTQEKEQEELEFKRSIIRSYLACEFYLDSRLILEAIH